jgi:type IV pilus assembly protein PilP
MKRLLWVAGVVSCVAFGAAVALAQPDDKGGAPTVAPGAEGTPAPSDPAAQQDPEQRVAMLRNKTLRDEDFVESENNRDPFRSHFDLFTKQRRKTTRKVPAIFDNFALEELTLIGIVSGGPQPRAMFRDSAGLGRTIKRGDYVSRTGARVAEIFSDRIVVELTEVVSNTESRIVEKAIFVNPEDGNQ